MYLIDPFHGSEEYGPILKVCSQGGRVLQLLGDFGGAQGHFDPGGGGYAIRYAELLGLIPRLWNAPKQIQLGAVPEVDLDPATWN